MPACKLFLTLNMSLLSTEEKMTHTELSTWQRKHQTTWKDFSDEHLLAEGRGFAGLVLFGVDRLWVGVGEGDADCLAVFHEDGLGRRYSRVLEVGVGHLSLGHVKISGLIIVVEDSGCDFFGGPSLGNHD